MFDVVEPHKIGTVTVNYMPRGEQVLSVVVPHHKNITTLLHTKVSENTTQPQTTLKIPAIL